MGWATHAAGRIRATGRFRRPVDVLIVIAGVTAVLAGIIALDPRVESEAQRLAAGDAPRTGAALTQTGYTVAASAWDMVLSHGLLAGFALVAIVLVVVLLRT